MRLNVIHSIKRSRSYKLNNVGKKSRKPCDHLNQYRRAIGQKSTSIHVKNSQQTIHRKEYSQSDKSHLQKKLHLTSQLIGEK